MAIREKLGVSKPRISGFDCGSFSLENQDFSGGWGLVVGSGGEGQAGCSAFLFGVRREGSPSMSGASGFSIGRGAETSSLVGTCSMSREFKGEEVEGHPAFVGMQGYLMWKARQLIALHAHASCITFHPVTQT